MIAGQLEIQMLANMARLQKDMNDAKRHVGGAMDNIQKNARRTMNVLGGIGAGVSVGLLINKFKQVAVETDQLRGNLVTVTGSADLAATAFDNLTQFASKTPFTLDQSVNAFIKLKALGLDPSERALASYGNTAAAMGKSMNQMIEAVADASTGEFERLKEFGIKAKSEGDQVSFTFQGLTHTIGKNSREIQEYLLGIGETKFGDAMANQMDRLPGQLSNLEDNIDGLFRKLADDGGTAIFAAGIGGASDSVAFLTDNVDVLYDGLILVAGVATARLVPSITASSLSFVMAQREAIRYQAALAAMSGISTRAAFAQTALATSTTALRGALALVGGPIGAVTLAIGGLALAYHNLKKRQEEARESMLDSFGGQTIKQIQQNLNGYTGEIVRLEEKIVSLRGKSISGDLVADMAEIRQAQTRIADLRDIVDRLTASLNALKAQQDQTSESTAQMSDSFQALIDRQEPLTRGMPVLATNIMLVEEGIGVLSPATQILNAELVDMDSILGNLKNGIFPGFNVNVEEAAFRMKGVSDATIKTTDDLDVHKNMIENVQREWANLIDTFIDGESDIGDFFDTFVKGIKRVIAEAAAADLAGLIFGGDTNNLSNLLPRGGGTGGKSGGVSATDVANLASAGLSWGSIGTAGASAAGAVGIGTLSTTGGWVAPSMANPATLSAAGGAGTGFGANAMAFITSPVGIALMAGLAGKIIHDATNDPDGFHRGMAGFLASPTPGAPAGSTFNVDAFASGFAPVGFADGPASQQYAQDLIEQFRSIDAAVTQAVRDAGGQIDMSAATLGGFDIDGKDQGTFFGRSQLTTDAQFSQQLDSYLGQLVNHIEGLTPEVMANLMGADGGAKEIIDVLGDAGLAGQISELVLANGYSVTQAGSLLDSQGSVIATMDELISVQELLPAGIEAALISAYGDANTPIEVAGMLFSKAGDLVGVNGEVVASSDTLSSIMSAMPHQMRSSIEDGLLELRGIEEVNGLLFDQTGNLVDSNGNLIASTEKLNGILEILPESVRQMIDAAFNGADDTAAAPGGSNAVDAVWGDPYATPAGGDLSFAEQARRDRVEHNKELAANGYDFVTGTYRPAPSRPDPAISDSTRLGLTGLTVEEENRDLMIHLVNTSAETARVLSKFDGDGLPEERS